MIQIHDISYKYGKKSENVFDGLSLSFDDGKIYGLLGKNGVGKSTLLYLLSGLLHPKSGKITIDGREPRHREPSLLENLYFIPDEFELPNMTLRRYVGLYAQFYQRFSHEVLESCLQDFELTMDTQLNALSLGQKKRVLVSYALATQCRVLLMDEPTNGLDIPAKSLFRKMVARHMQDDQIIIVSTHQVHDVDSLLDHIIVLTRRRARKTVRKACCSTRRLPTCSGSLPSNCVQWATRTAKCSTRSRGRKAAPSSWRTATAKKRRWIWNCCSML